MSHRITAIVINTSLRLSRTGILASAIHHALTTEGVSVEALDLQPDSMPFCDGATCYSDPRTAALAEKIAAAQIIVVASPIYNYSLNAAAKNLLELTGSAWTKKVVGFVCNAGGSMSYMGPMNFGQMLMLDKRCRVVPRYVYATPAQLQDGTVSDPDIKERIAMLAKDLVDMER